MLAVCTATLVLLFYERLVKIYEKICLQKHFVARSVTIAFEVLFVKGHQSGTCLEQVHSDKFLKQVKLAAASL